MRDDQLAIACLFLAILGILFLAFMAREAKPEHIGINELSEGSVGRLVEVSGFVSSVSQGNGNFFLRVCSKECVKIVVFKGLAEEMKKYSVDLSLLEKGRGITVNGVVDEYRGELELKPVDRNSIELS